MLAFSFVQNGHKGILCIRRVSPRSFQPCTAVEHVVDHDVLHIRVFGRHTFHAEPIAARTAPRKTPGLEADLGGFRESPELTAAVSRLR